VLKKINKKIILVVDDNYRSGGTLQAINKVLWNIGSPRYVGYYVPLYANFSV
jgi:predicted amidophosphoribosyltransferase